MDLSTMSAAETESTQMDIKMELTCDDEDEDAFVITQIKEEPELLIDDNCVDDFRNKHCNGPGKRMRLCGANENSQPNATAQKGNLRTLLKEFQLENTFAALSACGFTYDRLRYINQDDLDTVFPGLQNTGLKAELREKIFAWKAKNLSEDTSTSVNSKVVSWVQAQDFSLSETPTSSQESNNLLFSSKTQVLEILKASFAGQGLLSIYREKKQLRNEDRKKLMSIIIEHCYDATTKRYIIPRPGQMEKIAEQIVKIFPSENKDIYYISRKNAHKHNPSGMLFNRFNNLNRKRFRKSEDREEDTANKQTSLMTDAAAHMSPQPEANYLHNKLKCMSSDDSDSMEFWKSTYSFRSSSVRNSKSIELILKEWPFYKDSGAPIFVDYDFEMMYPNKSSHLVNNWPVLEEKLIKYYKVHLKDKQFKFLFQSLENGSVDENSKDCILVMLLNAVLKPTHRYVTKIDGKNTVVRTTIKDAINSCIVHVKTVDDLEMTRENKLDKDNKPSKEPYLIVIGLELQDLRHFYVNYGGALQQFPTLIASVDFCFKIFHILHLQYPTESYLIWLFLQKYVYNIVTPDDTKSHVLSEFLENLKH